jgi:glycosyltransferase involved in cell wall biosynthesis
MPSPKITVYIACRNHRQFIEQAIESVLRQSVEDWELLIFDDGSDDASSDIIHLYGHLPAVRIFRLDGVGLPVICNLALHEARGEYIMRLDGDDYLDENILLVLSNYLDRNPEHALVFPDYYLTDEFGNITSREWRARLFDDNHALDMPPNGACTMVRRGILDEIGGYREDLGAQDGLDLWVKIRGRHRAGNVNLPLFYYRRHGANLTGNVRRIALARRRIKRDAIKGSVNQALPITMFIPCRRHYDFMPDLWRQQVAGKSLLQLSLETCVKSEFADRIIVACDNPEAEAVVARIGDPRCGFVLREPATTLRTHSLVPTISRIVQSFDPDFRGTSVIHYLQAPLVSTDALDESLTTLLLNDADCCFGVEELAMGTYRRTPHGLQPLTRPEGINYDIGAVYRDAQTVIAFRNRNLRYGALTGARIVHFAATPEEGFFIDSPVKLRMVEAMVAPTMEQVT